MSFPAALPGRRERQTESTRASLFQAALAEFRRVGFARASVSRIVREAGVSRPTFYAHFPTKEHVLLELEWLEERRLVERIEREHDLASAFGALVEGVLDLHERLDAPRLIRDMFAIYAQRPDDLPIDEQPYPIAATLGRLFRAASDQGDLRDGLDPADAARLFMASLLGLQVGAPTTPDRLRRDLTELFSLFVSPRDETLPN